MNLDNLSLGQLFAQADEIGNKYQSAEERAAFAQEMAEHVKEIAALAKEGAIAAGKSVWSALTSEKAQHIYKSISLAIILTLAVIAIGLSKAAQCYWKEWIKPVGLIVWAYGQDQSVKVWRVTRHRMECEWQNVVSLFAIVIGG